jgi:hypothetical protein
VRASTAIFSPPALIATRGRAEASSSNGRGQHVGGIAGDLDAKRTNPADRQRSFCVDDAISALDASLQAVPARRITMQPTNTESKSSQKTKSQIEKEINHAMYDLEQLADEIRLKIHLAELDIKDAWSTKLEPRLFEARVHAKEASAASSAAIESTLKAIRAFAASL